VFYFNTEPRLKWNKNVLASKTWFRDEIYIFLNFILEPPPSVAHHNFFIFHFRRGSMFKQNTKTLRYRRTTDERLMKSMQIIIHYGNTYSQLVAAEFLVGNHWRTAWCKRVDVARACSGATIDDTPRKFLLLGSCINITTDFIQRV